MIDIFKNKEQKEEFISTYQDPFRSDKVESIIFKIEKSMWSSDNGKINHRSLIRFKSGNTSGDHKIEADNFPELVEKTESFIRSL